MRRWSVVAVGAVALVTLGALPAWAASVELDRSFSSDGRATIDVLGRDNALAAVADTDGSYLLGSTRKDRSSGYRPFVSRFGNAGRLDKNFGRGGTKVLPIAPHGGATSGIIAADGSLLVAGWCAARRASGIYVAKVRANGSLDPAFGDNGARILATDTGIRNIQVAIQPAGSIMVAWNSYTSSDKPAGDYVVAKLGRAGNLDRSFGRSGTRTYDVGRIDWISDVGVDTSGRFYVLGTSYDRRNKNGAATLLRLSAGGQAATRKYNIFGRNGTQTLGLSLDDSDRVTLGLTPTTTPGWGALRLTPSLRLDRTYNRNGIATRDCRCYSSTSALTEQGLVMVGITKGDKDAKTLAVRLDARGRWDAGFSRQAKWNLFDGGEYPDDATVDPAGRLLVAGWERSRHGNATMARFTLS